MLAGEKISGAARLSARSIWSEGRSDGSVRAAVPCVPCVRVVRAMRAVCAVRAVRVVRAVRAVRAAVRPCASIASLIRTTAIRYRLIQSYGCTDYGTMAMAARCTDYGTMAMAAARAAVGVITRWQG